MSDCHDKFGVEW